jgi:hypothetical protein
MRRSYQKNVYFTTFHLTERDEANLPSGLIKCSLRMHRTAESSLEFMARTAVRSAAKPENAGSDRTVHCRILLPVLLMRCAAFR